MLFGKPDVERLRRKGNLRGLVKAMRRSSDESIRRVAARAIGELGDSSAVPELCAALERERTDYVRQAVAEALAKTADEETLPTLLKLTRKEFCPIAAETARGVARLDAAGTEVPAATMIEILEDRLKWHRRDSRDCSCGMRYTLEQHAFDVIRRRVTGEDVRALIRLLNLEDGGRAQPLVGPADVAGWLASGRRPTEVDLLDMVMRERARPDQGLMLRGYVVGALAKLKDRRAMAPLLARLPLEDPYIWLHRDIFVAVASFGDRSVTDALDRELARFESLHDGDVERYFASELIALVALAPPDLDDRLAALITGAKSTAKIEMIVQHMRDADKAEHARKAREQAEFDSVLALDVDGIDSLMRYLDTRRDDVLRALAAMEGDLVVEVLISWLLMHDNAEVWRFAIAELGRRQDRRGVFPLIDFAWATGDRAGPAAEALARFGIIDIDAYLLAALDDPAERAGAVERVERGPAAVEPLLRIVVDKKLDYHLRSRAAMALGKIGDRRAVPALCSVLKHDDSSDPFCHVTRAAVWALRDIGDPAALAPLRAVHAPEMVARSMADDDYYDSAAAAAGSIDAVIHFLELETS